MILFSQSGLFMSHTALFLRSFVFMVVVTIATIIWSFPCFLFAFFSYRHRYYWTSRWNVFVIECAKVICGIRYQIKGIENLPSSPVILLSKHQSAWETIFYVACMPRPLVYVYKKELAYVPFFGWGLTLLRMIPIDRSKTKNALTQLIKVGKKRLQENCWVILFPEGTRILPGKKGTYKLGGARFAIETQTAIVPVAVNSGECWAKNSFVKKPGLITVSIGPLINSEGKTPLQLMQQAENWIEAEMQRLSPHLYPEPLLADML